MAVLMEFSHIYYHKEAQLPKIQKKYCYVCKRPLFFLKEKHTFWYHENDDSYVPKYGVGP